MNKNLHEIRKFFYREDTMEIHREKVISVIVLLVALISLLIYGRVRNKRLSEERDSNERYTIGWTLQGYKNFRSPNPTVKYQFKMNDRQITGFEEIPDYLHEKVLTTGGRYYVQFSFKNPNNCKLLLEYPVPDSIVDVPAEGWGYMPGYLNNQ